MKLRTKFNITTQKFNSLTAEKCPERLKQTDFGKRPTSVNR